MIKYPILNDLEFSLKKRMDETSVEWNSRSLSITNLVNFKNTSEKNKELSVTLTFPYGEAVIPCATTEILMKFLDKLENFLKLKNQVSPPLEPEAVNEIKQHLNITPNQVLKISPKQDLILAGLKDLGIEAKKITLYYEQNLLKPVTWSAATEEEAQAIFEKIQEHLAKVQILKIFKTLQNNNPIATPQELWEKATETHNWLIQLKLTPFY
jgi:hypothetical protein